MANTNSQRVFMLMSKFENRTRVSLKAQVLTNNMNDAKWTLIPLLLASDAHQHGVCQTGHFSLCFSEIHLFLLEAMVI